MPTNLLGLLQGLLTLVITNPDLIPQIVKQIGVALDAIATLFAGKKLSDAQLAGIDAAYDHIMGVADELEIKILGPDAVPALPSPEDKTDHSGK
jgi:hypothetical protein